MSFGTKLWLRPQASVLEEAIHAREAGTLDHNWTDQKVLPDCIKEVIICKGAQLQFALPASFSPCCGGPLLLWSRRIIQENAHLATKTIPHRLSVLSGFVLTSDQVIPEDSVVIVSMSRSHIFPWI